MDGERSSSRAPPTEWDLGGPGDLRLDIPNPKSLTMVLSRRLRFIQPVWTPSASASGHELGLAIGPRPPILVLQAVAAPGSRSRTRTGPSRRTTTVLIPMLDATAATSAT